MIHELTKYGFIWIRKKELQCINSSTYWLFFYLWNFGHIPTLRGEVVNMLEVAKEMMVDEGKLSIEEGEKDIPAINLRRAVPRLPGVDTSIFDKYTGEMQEGRRCLQLEIDDDEAASLEPVVEYAKKEGLHLKMLGTWVHITKPVSYDDPSEDIKRFVKKSQSHTNYHCSMALKQLQGIINVEGTAVIINQAGEEIGRYTMKEVLMHSNENLLVLLWVLLIPLQYPHKKSWILVWIKQKTRGHCRGFRTFSLLPMMQYQQQSPHFGTKATAFPTGTWILPWVLHRICRIEPCNTHSNIHII